MKFIVLMSLVFLVSCERNGDKKSDEAISADSPTVESNLGGSTTGGTSGGATTGGTSGGATTGGTSGGASEVSNEIIDIKTGEVLSQEQINRFISTIAEVCLQSVEAKQLQSFIKDIEKSLFEKSYYYFQYESQLTAFEILKDNGIIEKIQYLASEYGPTLCSDSGLIDVKTGEAISKEKFHAFLSALSGVKVDTLGLKEVQAFLAEVNKEVFEKSYYYYVYESQDIAYDILKEQGVIEKLHALEKEFGQQFIEIIDAETKEVVSAKEVIAFSGFVLDLEPEQAALPQIQELMKSVDSNDLHKLYYIYTYHSKDEARGYFKANGYIEKAQEIIKSLQE